MATANLSVESKDFTLPVVEATAGADGIDEWIFLEPRNRLDDDGSRYRLDDAERQQVSDQLQDLYRAYGKKLHVIDEADDARRLAAAERLVRSWIA